MFKKTIVNIGQFQTAQELSMYTNRKKPSLVFLIFGSEFIAINNIFVSSSSKRSMRPKPRIDSLSIHYTDGRQSLKQETPIIGKLTFITFSQ